MQLRKDAQLKRLATIKGLLAVFSLFFFFFFFLFLFLSFIFPTRQVKNSSRREEVYRAAAYAGQLPGSAGSLI
jgi:hypothetical protein